MYVYFLKYPAQPQLRVLGEDVLQLQDTTRIHTRLPWVGRIEATEQYGTIHYLTYPNVVLEAFLMLVQICTPHKMCPRPRRHHGPQEPWMTSVVC
jgi:hypothetical protein